MIKINKPACPNILALSNGDYKHPENKNALINASFGKCIYCESRVTHIYVGDVEHIKPKIKYPNLKFDWLNLGFVCYKCNNIKNDKYYDNTPYINPYEEDPEDFIFALGAFIKHKKGSERGELTINDIGLNRAELIGRRQENMDRLNKAIDACMRTRNVVLKENSLKAIKLELEKDKEYSLFMKTLLQLHQII